MGTEHTSGQVAHRPHHGAPGQTTRCCSRGQTVPAFPKRRRLREREPRPVKGSRALVLVENPHAGRGTAGLRRADQAIRRVGLAVREAVPVHELERLRPWLERPAAERPLIVAAGGDGTVGAAADYVARTDGVLGILPLGTSNDVARSLDIPLRIEQAVGLLATGPVSTVDLGQFIAPGARPRHFVHAAALGASVAFARVATRVSVRKRLGRLTYTVAAALALRAREVFPCTLVVEGRQIPLDLLHLSVINAPVFGGFFGLRLHGSDVDDRRLDVLAIENVSLARLVLAALLIVLRRPPHVGGVHLYHVRHLHVHVEQPVEVSLDGEVVGHVPGDFVLAAEALRVVTGPRFVGVDDDDTSSNHEEVS
jgi:diacylglycerol kinase family enzyme